MIVNFGLALFWTVSAVLSVVFWNDSQIVFLPIEIGFAGYFWHKYWKARNE